MNYEKIKSAIEAIEASDKNYFEFKSPVDLMLQYGYTKPDAVASMVFEEAWKYGGIVLAPILRRLELQHLGVNCHSADYWLSKLESKYVNPNNMEQHNVSVETSRKEQDLEVPEYDSNASF